MDAGSNPRTRRGRYSNIQYVKIPKRVDHKDKHKFILTKLSGTFYAISLFYEKYPEKLSPNLVVNQISLIFASDQTEGAKSDPYQTLTKIPAYKSIPTEFCDTHYACVVLGN